MISSGLIEGSEVGYLAKVQMQAVRLQLLFLSAAIVVLAEACALRGLVQTDRAATGLTGLGGETLPPSMTPPVRTVLTPPS